jgi:hypothetical protein
MMLQNSKVDSLVPRLIFIFSMISSWKIKDTSVRKWFVSFCKNRELKNDNWFGGGSNSIFKNVSLDEIIVLFFW